MAATAGRRGRPAGAARRGARVHTLPTVLAVVAFGLVQLAVAVAAAPATARGEPIPAPALTLALEAVAVACDAAGEGAPGLQCPAYVARVAVGEADALPLAIDTRTSLVAVVNETVCAGSAWGCYAPSPLAGPCTTLAGDTCSLSEACVASSTQPTALVHERLDLTGNASAVSVGTVGVVNHPGSWPTVFRGLPGRLGLAQAGTRCVPAFGRLRTVRC